MSDVILASIASIVSGVFTLWLRGISMKIKDLDERLRQAPSREEVSKEIEVRQESIKVLQQEIKEDIKEVKQTLIKLIEKS